MLNTVKTHGSSIYRKLDVTSRQELFLRYLDVGERAPLDRDGLME